MNLQSPVTETRLQNGLKVLLQESQGSPLVSVGCWYRVGSKDDPPGVAGLSNLARLLRLRETDGYSRDQVLRFMRETGGDWHSVTLPDQTGFFETVPLSALEEVLKLEAARMSGKVIEDLVLRREQRRAAIAIHEREDRVRSFLDDEVAAAAFQRHAYRWPTLGWLPDLAMIRREDIERHHRQYFVPSNAVLVLVGGFEARSVLALAEKHFGALARRPDPRRAEVREPERRGERRLRIVNEGATPYLQFAFQSPELDNDDFYAMLLIDAVLTGAQGLRQWSDLQPALAKSSSRLFRSLVNTGLALGVSSSVSPRQAPGLYRLILSLPDAFQLQAAEEALLEQLERLKYEEVSDVELAKARNLLVGGEFLGQNSVSKRAFQLGYFESLGSYQLLNDIEFKISRVSKDDLRRVAIHYLAENARTVGSVMPTLKRRTVEVETLSASGSDSQTPVASGQQSLRVPKELNVRVPSFQAVFTPESLFDSRVSNGSGQAQQGKPVSQNRAFGEFPLGISPALKNHRTVLPNGVTLIAVRNPSGSTVTIRAAIRIGTSGEGQGQTGLATLVNALLQRRLSARKQVPLPAVFDFLGADVSENIDDTASATIVRGLSKDLGTFLELLAEMLQTPSFTSAEFGTGRDELLGRLRELAEDPGWTAEQALRQRVFPSGRSLQRDTFGGSVENLRLSDVQSFCRRYYRPDRLIVSIAGDISPEEAIAAGQKAFGSWKSETGSAPSPATAPAASQNVGGAPQNPKRTALVMVGIASLSVKEPDYYAFQILNQILSGTPGGGRVGERVAGDTAVHGLQGKPPGKLSEQLYSIRAVADPSEAERATGLIREEFARVRDQGLVDEEVKRAKRSLIHAWAILLSSNDSLAQTLQHMETYGLGPDYLERYPSLIEGVSRESLLDCARTRLNFDQAAVVVTRYGVAN